jgi:hypothetical protein
MVTSPIHREQRADEYHTDHRRGALDGSVIRTVSPGLAVAGWATLIPVVYGAVLYVAAVAVLELVALLSGLAGFLLLFTAGMAGIAAAPSVAHWTLMRVFGSAQ